MKAQHSSPRSILLVSAGPGGGKSTVAADLASSMYSEAGEQVMLIEADFRRPVQARALGLEPDRGLSDVLTGRLALADALQVVHAVAAQVSSQPSTNGAVATAVQPQGPGAVWALVAGPQVPNPPALLAGAAMADLVRAAAEDYDRVVIDAPGPLAVSDVMPLLGIVETVVLVARVGHTREQAAVQLHQLLARTPTAPVLGVDLRWRPRAEISKYGAGISPKDAGRVLWSDDERGGSPARRRRRPTPRSPAAGSSNALIAAAVALVIGAATVGIAIAVPTPSIPWQWAGSMVAIFVGWLAATPRLERSVTALVIFLGCVNGPVKLIANAGALSSGLQDILVLSITLGLIFRMIAEPHAGASAAALRLDHRVGRSRSGRVVQSRDGRRAPRTRRLAPAAPVGSVLLVRIPADPLAAALPDDVLDPRRGGVRECVRVDRNGRQLGQDQSRASGPDTTTASTALTRANTSAPTAKPTCARPGSAQTQASAPASGSTCAAGA